MYYFTADEHYGHANIIKFTSRPFSTVEEMDATIIANHNEVVKDCDLVVHVGDLTLKSKEGATEYIRQLNGSHIFIRGSHDYWLDRRAQTIWEKKIEGQYIVACHYAMRSWPRSFHGSWQVFGHSHGRLQPIGKQWDVGVDNNNFYPVSFEQLAEIMKEKDNTVD